MYCDNKTCTKTHCSNHQSNHKDIFEPSKDMNVDNCFKCPSYSSKFKGLTKKTSVEIFTKKCITYIREYTIDEKNGKKNVLNVYEQTKHKKHTNY